MKKGWQFELQEGERSIVDRVRIWLTEKCHLVDLFTMLLSPLTHHKCCQKDIPQKYLKNHPLYTVTVTTNSPQVMPKGYHKWMKNLTLSTLLLSPQVLSKGLWVKKFKNVSLSTLLLLPLIHHKCCQKAYDYKKLKQILSFYTVTVTTNSLQVFSFLHHNFSKNCKVWLSVSVA